MLTAKEIALRKEIANEPYLRRMSNLTDKNDLEASYLCLQDLYKKYGDPNKTLDQLFVKWEQRKKKILARTGETLWERTIDKKSLCVMLGLHEILPAENWVKLLNSIDEEDLHEYGKEYDPHVSLFYADEWKKKFDQKEVNKYSKLVLPIDLTVTGVGLFENEEFDVLKFEVQKTITLEQAQQQSVELFEATPTYPDYTPHMTLAYLLPGKGKQYQEKLSKAISFPFTYTSNKLIYAVSNSQQDTKYIFQKK